MVLFNQSPRAKAMTVKIKKEKKSILLENTFLPFGVEMLFSWFIIDLFTMYLHLQTEILQTTFSARILSVDTLQFVLHLEYLRVLCRRNNLSATDMENLCTFHKI